jgi:ubiquinone/menaquinone biosynthesis C-methylase UbiE
MNISQETTELQYWESLAPSWQKHHRFFNRQSTAVTDRMLSLAGVGPGSRVLDIATGTGGPALAAAHRVGPHGSVLGTDFVEEILVFARAEAARLGLRSAEFRCMDGERLALEPGTFDAVTIRWGLMFMPDPGACLAGVHRALRPGGKIAVACWSPRDENPWLNVPLQILRRMLDVPLTPPGAPGPFAFAAENALAQALASAGFHEVVAERVEFPMAEFDSVQDYFAYVCEIAGPIAKMYASLTPQQREAFDGELAQLVRGRDGSVRLAGTTWVAAGRR